MFAIVETGGKQYKISPNQRLVVEKIEGDIGAKITLDKVLVIQEENKDILLGAPLLSGANVQAEIVRTFKDEKVIIFKKRRRQNSRRKNGHRQYKTELKILSINN